MRSRMQFVHAVTSAFAALAMMATNANGAPIVWDTVNAIAGGNGCNNTGPFPDTWLITAGDDVSIIFSRMGVDLTPESAVNTATTGCLVRIPVTIESAVAVTELDQNLLWGYAKDLGTTAQVTARSTFCGLPTSSISSRVGTDVEGVEALIETETQSFFVWPPVAPFCQGKPVNCLFQANLAVAARRAKADQDISVRIYGEDIEYEALAYWDNCY